MHRCQSRASDRYSVSGLKIRRPAGDGSGVACNVRGAVPLEAPWTELSALWRRMEASRRRNARSALMMPGRRDELVADHVIDEQPRLALLRSDGVGAKPADAAARVPADRDRRRGGAARRCDRGARVGERRRARLRVALVDDALDPRSAARASRSICASWVNSGLMTFFFFVVGLEARREFDLGELRERRRFALPFAAGLGGMVVAVAIYLAFNAGRSSAHGWGVAMSTDTAFALGLLALVGPRFPDRLRAFMLTVVVVDDIARAGRDRDRLFGTRCSRWPLLRGLRVLRRRLRPVHGLGLRVGLVYLVLGVAAWVALAQVGGRAGRDRPGDGRAAVRRIRRRARRLERATERFREFREQPTAELARTAGAQLRAATSAQRTPAAALPPVDELRDRAAVRARERRHRDRRRLPRTSVHARRSRSGSCSATSSASRSGSSAARGWSRG